MQLKSPVLLCSVEDGPALSPGGSPEESPNAVLEPQHTVEPEQVRVYGS